MNGDMLFKFILLMIGIGVKAALDADGNGYGHEKCDTVTVTTTIYDPAPKPSTFIYTKTEVVPGGSAQVVTKSVDKPGNIEIVTSIAMGKTKIFTIYSTKKKYIGATTTKTYTTTITTYPYATTSTTQTEYLVVFVKGTLTVTYPPPPITFHSFSRYTGAPTSLWLSVI